MAATVVDKLTVKLVGDTKQYSQAMKTAQANTEKFTRDAQGRYRNTAGQFVKMTSVIEQQANRLKKIGGQISSIGRSLTMRLTTPLTIFGGLAVREFARFDQAMTESTSIMKVTQQQTEQMRQTAISLSGESSKSATDLAQSYFYLASAGKDAAQSMALLPKVTAFAIAGAFDMATATDLLTDAQSALGMSVKDNVTQDMLNLVRVSDVLVKANTLANASVEQFSIALTSKAGASLKAFNKDIEEGVAVLAAFADQGVKAELAGNQLDRVIRLLSNSSMDNAEAHKRLGFSVFDNEGKMRNLGDIIGNLENILAGMSNQTKVVTLDMLGFEARVQQAILPLLGTSEAIKEYERELRRAGGTTQEVADKQMESFANQMKIVWNNIKNFAASIGQQLGPKLLALGEELKRLTAWWQSLSDTTKSWVTNIGLAVAATGPLLMAMGTIIKSLGIMKLAMNTLKLPVSSLFNAWTVGLTALIALYAVGRSAVASMNAEMDKSTKDTSEAFDRRLDVLAGMEGPRQLSEIDRTIEAQKNQLVNAEQRARQALVQKANQSYAASASEYLFGTDTTAPLIQGFKDAQNELQKLQKLRDSVLNKSAKDAAKAEQDSLEAQRQILERVKAKKAELKKTAEELLTTYQMQVQTVGMLPREASIYRLEQQNVNGELIEQLRIQDEILTKKEKEIAATKKLKQEAERAAQKDKKSVADIVEKNKTPAQRLRATINELRRLTKLEENPLSIRDARQATRRAFATYQSGMSKKVTTAGPGPTTASRGIKVGTSEYYNLVGKLDAKKGGKTTQDKMLTTMEEIRDTLQEQEAIEAAEFGRSL